MIRAAVNLGRYAVNLARRAVKAADLGEPKPIYKGEYKPGRPAYPCHDVPPMLEVDVKKSVGASWDHGMLIDCNRRYFLGGGPTPLDFSLYFPTAENPLTVGYEREEYVLETKDGSPVPNSVGIMFKISPTYERSFRQRNGGIGRRDNEVTIDLDDTVMLVANLMDATSHCSSHIKSISRNGRVSVRIRSPTSYSSAEINPYHTYYFEEPSVQNVKRAIVGISQGVIHRKEGRMLEVGHRDLEKVVELLAKEEFLPEGLRNPKEEAA